MLERRVHYRRQNHYATKSNKYKIVKTPGKFCSIGCAFCATRFIPCADC